MQEEDAVMVESGVDISPNVSVSYPNFKFSIRCILHAITQPSFPVDWCPDPPDVTGGVVTTTGKRAGSTATYTCQSGFILFGDNVSNRTTIKL